MPGNIVLAIVSSCINFKEFSFVMASNHNKKNIFRCHVRFCTLKCQHTLAMGHLELFGYVCTAAADDRQIKR